MKRGQEKQKTAFMKREQEKQKSEYSIGEGFVKLQNEYEAHTHDISLERKDSGRKGKKAGKQKETAKLCKGAF